MSVLLITIALTLVLIVVFVVLVRRQLTPPLEVDLSARAMHLNVHRAPVQEVTIMLDNGGSIVLDDVAEGTTQIPWNRFGIVVDPGGTAPDVQQIVITGRRGERWFETTIAFGTQPNAKYVSQIWNYTDGPDAPAAKTYTAAPEQP